MPRCKTRELAGSQVLRKSFIPSICKHSVRASLDQPKQVMKRTRLSEVIIVHDPDEIACDLT